MITYILMLWVLIKLSAPAWCYILLAVGAICKAFVAGKELNEK